MQAIAEFRQQTYGEIMIHHTKLVGGRRSLTEFANGDCTFLDPKSRRCSIYPVRPIQCRTWPFWPANLVSREAWDRARTLCPGMDRGPLVQLDVIERQASEIDP